MQSSFLSFIEIMNKHVNLKKNEKFINQENDHIFLDLFKIVNKLNFTNFFSLLETYFNLNIPDIFRELL